MTVPTVHVSSMVNLLSATVKALMALPHQRRLICLLAQQIDRLKPLLEMLPDKQLTVSEESALNALEGALTKVLRVAQNWQKHKLRLLLEGSMLADELSITSTEIQECLRTLQPLLKVLRNMYSEPGTSGDLDRLLEWLARHLDAEVDSIRQEWQELKENNDCILHSKREVETELLEQLIVCIAEFEERKMCIACASNALAMAKANSELTCSICHNLMTQSVVIDSGQSYCRQCIESWFAEGRMTCPVTRSTVTSRFVSNLVLQNVIACFGGTNIAAAVSPGEAESSDNDSMESRLDEPLEEMVRSLVPELESGSGATVLKALDGLVMCAKTPNGRLEVFRAGAIPALIKLVQTNNPPSAKRSVRLLKALTSSKGVDQGMKKLDRERVKIFLEVSDALDVLLPLMKEDKLSKLRLLAAETVANILVDKQIRLSILNKDGIVPAFFAFSNVDAEGQPRASLRRADRICVKGLTLLANTTDKGDKAEIIVAALVKLVTKGHNSSPELVDLVKDSLVALEVLVLSMENVTNANARVCLQVQEAMTTLVPALLWHSTPLGRKAIIDIVRKMCALYEDKAQELITEKLIHNLLKFMKVIRSEDSIQSELLSCSMKLLSFCVSHAKPIAFSVLTKHEEERKILEDILVTEETSGSLDECKLEILSIIDALGIESTQSTVAGGVAILVKMARSPASACREKVAYRLRKFVDARKYSSKIQEAGGINALKALLEDESRDCQCHALIALEALSQTIKFSTSDLPLHKVLDFLRPHWEPEVQDAAVGLLGLMVNDYLDRAVSFVDIEGALEDTIKVLGRNPSSAGSSKCASALLKMAIENHTVRLRIAEAGLGRLVDYVKEQGSKEFKELLITMLTSLCQEGENCEEAVVMAGGHEFLLTSLRDNISKESAARGLLDLIRKTRTREGVLVAGYVKIAMESIDHSFASVHISNGLAQMSSVEQGLDEIYANTDSVLALLTLLEHCPDLEGRSSAAGVIAKLLPRLQSSPHPEDLERQKLILEACSQLIKLVKTQSKDVLEALAAIAVGPQGKLAIFEERVLPDLLGLFPIGDTNIEDLVLKILVDLSGEIQPDNNDRRNQRIRSAMLESRITTPLFTIADSPRLQNPESLKSVLKIIRNLSLAGPNACEQLEGAVPLLLKVLKGQTNYSAWSDVTELAVKALEKFMEDAHERLTLVKQEGVKHLVTVLKLDNHEGFSEAKNYATIILTAVAKDPQTRKTVCKVIYNADPFTALNEILFEGSSNKSKWQAAVLLKLLAMYGPSEKVFPAMYRYGCIDALIALRDVEHCEEMARDVLKYVGDKDKTCRKMIQRVDAAPRRVRPNIG